MIRHASAVAIVLVLNATPVATQSAVAPNAELLVKRASADVHKSPSVASPIVGKASGGTVLEIRRNLGSWVEVSWPHTEAGIAFLHVNTGTIAPRSQAAASTPAQAAVAQIAAVDAAATAAVSAGSYTPAGRSVATRQATSQSTGYVSELQHRIGMGISMNASKPSFGATARTWFGRRLGVQFSAARPDLQNADGRMLTSTQFSPSVLYSLPDGMTSSLWVRPYLGAGSTLYRANLENQLGHEAFGGAEITFAAMPQVALSVATGYRFSRPSFDGFEPRRVGFSLSGHWYVK